MLRDGFLHLWNEKRRWLNEPVQIMAKNISGTFLNPGMPYPVSMRGALHVSAGESYSRIVYPYFSENPPLGEEGARLILWAMTQALPDHHPDEMRVIDVIRAKSFSLNNYPLSGNEEDTFRKNCIHISSEWEKLIRQYE